MSVATDVFFSLDNSQLVIIIISGQGGLRAGIEEGPRRKKKRGRQRGTRSVFMCSLACLAFALFISIDRAGEAHTLRGELGRALHMVGRGAASNIGHGVIGLHR